jgi:hypothetical protein
MPREFMWMVGKEAFPTKFEEGACPFCHRAVVCALPPPIRAAQPDDTTHVCHPFFGGCNQGFAKEE